MFQFIDILSTNLDVMLQLIKKAIASKVCLEVQGTAPVAPSKVQTEHPSSDDDEMKQ